ncbi:MAG: potassium channel family protein [Acidimicrobiales bacterium]
MVAVAALRTILTVALVVAIYFLLPMDRPVGTSVVIGLVLGLLVFAAIIAWQVRQIVQSKYPLVRGVEALAFALPVYILLFATTYFLMTHAQVASFGEHLSRTDAMYFSTTVFTTVGFGDITAKTQTARLVVTFQMLFDLVILGLVARLIINAIKRGQQQRAT